MMTRNATHPPALSRTARSPNGTRTQVGVRLTDTERAELEQVASEEMRSVSAMARLFIIEALQRRREETAKAS